MAVTAIRLGNFMGFEDTGWFELRPLTLLFGKNSSGKSAIIRTLLLLHQSLDTPPDEGPFRFVAEGQMDLGSFTRLIREHAVEVMEDLPDGSKQRQPRLMMFGFRCDVPHSMYDFLLELAEPREQDGVIQLEFSLHYQWNTADSRVEIAAATIAAPIIGARDERLIVLETLRVRDPAGTDVGWSAKSGLHELDELLTDSPITVEVALGFLPALMFESLEQEALEETLVRREAIVDVFDHCVQEIRRFLSQIRYVGPFRYEPQRYYFLPTLSHHKLDTKGMGVIRDYLHQEDESSGDTDTSLDRWMQTFKLGARVSKEGSTFELDPSAPAVLYEIRVDNHDAPLTVSLCEIGYGASQVLPVILHSLFAPEEALVIVEQPEVHLHPEAQAHLADLFIEQIQGRKRFLIETHSEHLLLRLQRRIIETAYDKAVSHAESPPLNAGYAIEGAILSLIFVYRQDGNSHIEIISFDDHGQLVNPSLEFQNFFRYDYDEVVALQEATALLKRLEAQE